jgi:hypothetical protein
LLERYIYPWSEWAGSCFRFAAMAGDKHTPKSSKKILEERPPEKEDAMPGEKHTPKSSKKILEERPPEKEDDSSAAS